LDLPAFVCIRVVCGGEGHYLRTTLQNQGGRGVPGFVSFGPLSESDRPMIRTAAG